MTSADFPVLDGLQAQQPLARFTAARLGGPADYLYIARDPEYGDAIKLMKWAWQQKMPVTVIGGGANILVSDKGIRGLTVINHAAGIEMDERGDGARVTAASGTSLIRLSRFCLEHGLRGLEWAIAVPGTVGGAVVNNAGAHGSDVASSLSSAKVYEAESGTRAYPVAELNYDYRFSQLKVRENRQFFIVSATFDLARDDPKAIQERMNHNNDYRRRTQPPGASLGSIFKNPHGDYAGRLIEAAGLKGAGVGAVQVSPIHANFLVNQGGDAKASDYYSLIKLVQKRVYERFGVQLELEIQVLGDW